MLLISLVLILNVFHCSVGFWNDKNEEGFNPMKRILKNAYVMSRGPINDHFLPEIGNGNLATQMRNQWIFMNGIYNGDGSHSHRAAIPSTINWGIDMKGALQVMLSLRSAEGVFEEKVMFSGYNVSITTYVSRLRPQIIVRNITLETPHTNQTTTINTLKNIFNFTSPDFSFKVRNISNIILVDGQTNTGESSQKDTLPVSILTDEIPKQIILDSRSTWMSFITSIDTNVTKAINAFFIAKSNAEILLQEHCKEWVALWKDGYVYINSSNRSLTDAVHMAQYYILSSLPNKKWIKDDPTWFYYGLSPTGLAHGNDNDVDYMGHLFWDMEIWMFPAILPFHPEFSLEMIKYRLRLLGAAQRNSKSSGYKGAKYPWESARTGNEVSPSELCGKSEVHISGDISLAVNNFLWTIPDYDVVTYLTYGEPLLTEIARFWASRSVLNQTTHQMEIKDVMPPDEYVEHCNNSAFTNMIAKAALKAPLIHAKRFVHYVSDEMKRWFEMGNAMKLPFDNKNQIILEHDGYTIGQVVKQADVALLHYPLAINISEDVFRNNQNYYYKVSDPEGPAMTWSIFSINWFKLKDIKNAVKTFLRNFENIVPPFYVWSEISSGQGAVNFITGAGGFLQNMIYGFAGMRLPNEDNKRLHFDPTTTSLANELLLHNVKFHHSKFSVYANTSSITVVLLNDMPIVVLALKDDKSYLLIERNDKATIAIQPFEISSVGLDQK